MAGCGVIDTGKIWICCGPEEDHKNDPRDSTPPLRGQAERTGAVQPGEEKAPGRSENSLSVSKGGYKIEGDRLFRQDKGKWFQTKEGEI